MVHFSQQMLLLSVISCQKLAMSSPLNTGESRGRERCVKYRCEPTLANTSIKLIPDYMLLAGQFESKTITSHHQTNRKEKACVQNH